MIVFPLSVLFPRCGGDLLEPFHLSTSNEETPPREHQEKAGAFGSLLYDCCVVWPPKYATVTPDSDSGVGGPFLVCRSIFCSAHPYYGLFR